MDRRWSFSPGASRLWDKRLEEFDFPFLIFYGLHHILLSAFYLPVKIPDFATQTEGGFLSIIDPSVNS